MNARVFSIASTVISIAVTIDLAYTAIKYIRRCDKLEKEIKELKAQQVESAN